MNLPKETRSYCPKCKSHQTMKVSIYKAGKRRGSAAGEGWELHDNNAQGLVIEHATVHANWINSTQNGLSGAYIHDSSNVILNNLTTTSNGDLAGSSLHGSGITFHLSNDVETSGKDVTCINCTSIDDALGGVIVELLTADKLSLIHISEPTRRYAISYAVF